jgi:hypothetical protein
MGAVVVADWLMVKVLQYVQSTPDPAAEQGVALGRAGITVFRDITFLAVGPASEHRTRLRRDTTGRNLKEKRRSRGGRS